MAHDDLDFSDPVSEEGSGGGLENALRLASDRLPVIPGIHTIDELMEEAKESGVEEITLPELVSIRKANAPLTLVDLREAEERTSGNKIRGAINIPRGLLEMTIGEYVRDANGLIVVFCSNGIRSTLSAETLLRMGYRNVKVLSGGFQKIKRSMKKSQSE